MNLSKKFFAACLTLTVIASCGPDEEALMANAKGVVEGSKKTCNYVPTVVSIAAILGVPGAPAASELVDAICAEVNKIPIPESGLKQSQEIEIELPQGTVDGVLLPN